jgi:hypothetical protein
MLAQSKSKSAQNKKSGTEITHYRRPRPKPVPDHLVPSTPSLTDIPPLEVIARYRRDDGFTMTGEGVEVLVGDPARSQYDPVACGSTRAPNLPNAVSASMATTRSSWRTCAKLDPAQAAMVVCRSGSAGWWSWTISPDGVSWSCSNCVTIFTRTTGGDDG